MTDKSLEQEILAILKNNPGVTAREIAGEINIARQDVNQYLHGKNGITVRQDSSYRWYLHDRVEKRMSMVGDPRKYDAQNLHADVAAQHSTQGNESSDPVSLVGDVLESLRRRLLDLTPRNRLLNFRHPQASSIRIIDELPNQLKQFLIDDEREMRFIPVPDPSRKELIEAGYIEIDAETKEERLLREPTAKEWAEYLGFDTNFETPAAAPEVDEEKHSDNAIQTMFFPDELESRLRSMRQKANSAIEETGANILYFALGFLEWYESRDKTAIRLAPLYLVPVRLDRGKLNQATSTYEYRLSYSGEDILTNISLREKLKNDFHIALPELEDGVAPEVYLSSVADALVSSQPDWRIRRFVTLCHLNFSKQLLYLDLDPAKWPTAADLLGHRLVRQCLTGLQEISGDENGVEEFGEEHAIDELDAIHERYPLIDDADSSQHSALIDAIDGKDLVIEGPPGTGKSQTITNLIAAAIANNKTILFVAEKSAALEVVKRRLDQAGLGDFCLELHSHRSHKRRVLDDLDRRAKLKQRLIKPAEIESDIKLHEDLKERLRRHAQLVNAPWKNTGMTVHQVLAAATRYRHKLGIDPNLVHPDNINGASFTTVERKKVVGQAATLATVYEGVLKQLEGAATIYQHPWSGVRNTAILAFEQQKVIAALQQWQMDLQKLQSEISKLAEIVDANRGELPLTVGGIRDLVKILSEIATCDGSEPLFALGALRGEAATRFISGVQTYRVIQNYFDDLSQDIATPALENQTSVQLLASHIAQYVAVSARDTQLVHAREARQRLLSLCQIIDSIVEPIQQTNKSVSLPADLAFPSSVSGIEGFTLFAEIVSSLKGEYLPFRGEHFENEELDQAIPKMASELRLLLGQRKELESIYALDSLSDLAHLATIESEFRQAGMFSWLNANWRRARKDLLSLRAASTVKTKVLKAHLKQLVDYANSEAKFSADLDYKRVLGEDFVGLSTNLDRLLSLRIWYRRVRNEYGVGFGARVRIGDALINISDSMARAIRSLYGQGLRERVTKISADAEWLANRFPGIPRLADKLMALRSTDCPLNILEIVLCEHFPMVDQACNSEMTSAESLAVVQRKLQKLSAHIDNWSSMNFSDTFLARRIEVPVGVGKADRKLIVGLERVAAVAKLISGPECPIKIAEKIYREPSKVTVELLRVRNRMLSKAVDGELSTFQRFVETVNLDEKAWFTFSGLEIDSIIPRNERAMNNPEWLASWLGYLRSREQLENLGWAGIAQVIENQTIVAADAPAAVMLGATDVLAREILRETPDLETFSGLTQQGIQQQFQECDDRLRELQRELIAWKASRVIAPKGVSGGPVRNLTEFSLIEREIGKKKGHIPLRQLVARAGNALIALKPCFMMGPMSVAQYLAPGQLEFDLIVMDEASQVRPEDAIGAIARGRQLVVVGDPKQLPPTSFFDKLLDEEEEEEDFTAGQQSESILDAALTTFPARRLRWHYRSQHESLIAFSNHAYYGSNLVIFPSPINKAPDYGVQFTPVKRGRFINRVNREEAELIAKAVKAHMLARPTESIGVVAMSAQQREQIERAIEQETKEDAMFRDVVDRNQNENEPLFVKNLENVQGDERDVIYISMTYGPTDVGGKVVQRFGPINTIHGWRRLNVLFTRSKKRMHVFSSMGPEDIIVSPSSSRGVQSLKAFLEFAQTGNITSTFEHTGREPDSDFEVAVADALSAKGYECVPQVGVAGYFLDIAVKDPGRMGRYLMAIECDGATYHSAKSTRDRDHLRQRILERLGWRVRRIWSTDWFSNPAAQLKPIVDELNQLRTIPADTFLDEAVEAKGLEDIDEIDEIVEELEQEREFISTIVENEVDLKGRLEGFERDVIRQRYPSTAPEKRFLRSAMIDALLLYRPTTIWEFQQHIPPYLRHGTEPKEGEFIEPVMQIIYGSGAS